MGTVFVGLGLFLAFISMVSIVLMEMDTFKGTCLTVAFIFGCGLMCYGAWLTPKPFPQCNGVCHKVSRQ